METSDGRYVLVYNGELYNFRELREELISAGCVFNSSSDTEVVLQSLALWGKAAIDRFNGMFAFAFYDRLGKKLLLARDHAGMKPLYYLSCSKGIFFASQYNQILEHPWSKTLSVSQDALRLYLSLAYVPAPFGILENTHMLEPGTWMEIESNGKISNHRWFTFSNSGSTARIKGVEAITAVNEALERAVERHLLSDVPVAAFLSGGIDSPLIASMAKDYTRDSLQTFTLGTESEQSDESEDARQYAESLGLKQIIYKISSGDALNLLDEVISASGEPFGDFSMFPSMAIARLVSENYKVILSGDGGDELFWGYPDRAFNLMRICEYYRCPFAFRYLYKRLFGNTGNKTKYLPVAQKSLGNVYRSIHSHLSQELLDKIFPGLHPWPSGFDAFEYSDWRKEATANFARTNEFNSHLPMVLLKMDHASMHYSLETRIPFLDREVIDVALRIDWEDCLDLDAMIGKIPLRKSLQQRTDFQTTQKKGFSVPMGEWLRTTLRPLFEELVVNRQDLLGMEIDQKQMAALFDDHCKSRSDYAWGLWPLLSLALWEQKYLKG